MEVQLLLLAALLGLFSTCALAGPTVVPEDVSAVTPKEVMSVTTEVMEEEVTDVPWSPSTDPAPGTDVATMEPGTGVVTEETPVDTTSVPERTTEETQTVPDVGTTVEAGDTDGPTVGTEGPTQAPTEGETQPVSTDASKTGNEVIVEDGAEESLSSAQVFGIVIGVLLGAAFLIGVAVTVVRKRGKYSP